MWTDFAWLANQLEAGNVVADGAVAGWRMVQLDDRPGYPVLMIKRPLPLSQDDAHMAAVLLRAFDETASQPREPQPCEGLPHTAIDVTVDTLEAMADMGLFEIDAARLAVTWSDMAYQIHGVTRASFTPTLETMLGFYPDEVRGLARRAIGDALKARAGFSIVLPLIRADGQVRKVRCVASFVRETGRCRLLGLIQDVTTVHKAEIELWRSANHDVLTGLPNRMLFQERLRTAMEQAAMAGTSAGLILIDLDQFKSINDVYGHDAGDKLLRAVAERLGMFVRQGDTLARLGGDEYAIIVNNLATPEDIARPLERLLMAAEVEFQYRGIMIPVKLSMGAAVYPRDALDRRELYRNADLALFCTKDDVTRRGTLYKPHHGAERDRRDSTLRRIRTAIAHGEIAPHFQPVFDLETAAVASVEVLARWRDGDHVTSADTLRPAFADPELAPQLGLLMLDQLRGSWCTLGADVIGTNPLSLNVSPRELSNLTYVEALSAFLRDASASGAQIVLELSQNPANTLPSQVMPTIRRLVNDGAQFGFDTLAVGFEALLEATGLRVTQIKVHKHTLAAPAVETRAAAILGGMIATCRALGVQLIATEIETEADLRRVRKLGYTLGQGFHFRRAMDLGEIAALLTQGRSAELAAAPERV